MQKISGKCLCGLIQYESDAEPVFTIVCHCTDCQRQTGTVFSMTMGIPKQSLVFKNASLILHCRARNACSTTDTTLSWLTLYKSLVGTILKLLTRIPTQKGVRIRD